MPEPVKTRPQADLTVDTVEGSPIDLESIQFDPSWALQFPPNLLVRRRMLPLVELDGFLYVAVERELDESSRRILERVAKMNLRPVRATSESIRSLQTQLFGNLRNALELDRPVIEISSSSRNSDEAVEIFNQLLKSAVIRGASDIHMTILKNESILVRMRIDGVLYDDVTLKPDLRLPLFNRVKVLGGLDISEKRASQDGSFVFEPGGAIQKAEVRVATIPGRFGERITLRLLTQKGGLSLSKLGMSPRDEAQFSKAVELPNGMVLLTGPTGSGKSTTLYASILHLLKTRLVNVMTVEDPIEYELDGITQTQVDARKEKVSFASSLRSILRHDPDVIMLGEIRDRETAELAVRASLTGHMVYSTLHTNTAVGAVTRLMDLGVDRFLVASVLRLVAAQRLVRTLCQDCRSVDTISSVEALALQEPQLEGERCYREAGCLSCAGKGYRGRTGLFELLPIREEQSAVISGSLQGGSIEQTLIDLRDEMGNQSMRASGLQAIADGVSTISEVVKTTSEYV